MLNQNLQQEKIPLPLLPKRIALEQGKHSDPLFVLRDDTETGYGQVTAVLDALKQAGARKVPAAVKRRGRL
jgi:biopolymer transport protein ExbD